MVPFILTISLVKYDFHSSSTYAFKCLTKEYPLTFALTLVFGAILLMATLMRIFERPFRKVQLARYGPGGRYQDYETIENAIWCTIITMTTGSLPLSLLVGYGDFSPETLGARICESAACIGGGIVTTMTIVVMVNFLALNRHQKKAFFDLTIADPAALVIGSFFRYIRTRKNEYSIYSTARQHYRNLEKDMLKFILAKKKATIVAIDVIAHEEAMAKRLENKIEELENRVDQIMELLKNNTKKEKIEEEIKE